MLRTALAGRRGRTAVVLHCLRSTKTNRVYLKQGILDNSVVTVPSFLSAGLWSSNEVTRLINCGLSENSSSASSWQRAARFMSNSKREEKQVCWNCNAPAPACVGVLLLCSSCKAIQPPDSEIDFFEILGVKKEFDIDVKDLEKRYKDLQKKLHPDLFATKSKREQNYSADQSAHVIRAYQTLLKPLSRATYLLELHGCDLEGEGSVDDPELLMEIMEMQEAVAATSDAAHASEIQKQVSGQAVAVRVTMDKCVFYGCGFFDMTGAPDTGFLNYRWEHADVEISRFLFYMRVIPSILTSLKDEVLLRVVVPKNFCTWIVHMEHSSQLSSDKLSKEQLVPYYIERALEGYPFLTPFDAMASGVAAIVYHLPGGSPTIVHCIDCLVGRVLASGVTVLDNIEEVSNPSNDSTNAVEKLAALLVHLILLVDMQVLPYLLQQVAKVILSLPKHIHTVFLETSFGLIVGCITRCPTIIPWLQSISFLCSATGSEQPTARL